MRRVDIISASVMGMDHVCPTRPKYRKNNQDALSIINETELTIGIVCDGCGSLDHSEVGAKIGAALLGQALKQEIAKGRKPSEINWDLVHWSVIENILFLAERMGDNVELIIQDYFLFTTLGFLITETETLLFHLGDGVLILNGEVIEIGPFPDNAPPYLMYRHTKSAVIEKHPEFRNFHVQVIPTKKVKNIGVGTDGVVDIMCHEGDNFPGDLGTFIESFGSLLNEDYFAHADNLSSFFREMNQLTIRHHKIQDGLLPDDTTLILARVHPPVPDDLAVTLRPPPPPSRK